MARHVVGIVAAGVTTLLGGWVAVSAFALDDGGWTAVAVSNTVAGSALLVLGALGVALHISGLLAADRARRPSGWSTSLQPFEGEQPPVTDAGHGQDPPRHAPSGLAPPAPPPNENGMPTRPSPGQPEIRERVYVRPDRG